MVDKGGRLGLPTLGVGGNTGLFGVAKGISMTQQYWVGEDRHQFLCGWSEW